MGTPSSAASPNPLRLLILDELMAGVDTLREVIAFPKTQSAQCLMTNAPGTVPDESLRELSIRVRKPASE